MNGALTDEKLLESSWGIPNYERGPHLYELAKILGHFKYQDTERNAKLGAAHRHNKQHGARNAKSFERATPKVKIEK
jgi:hypothetical protein